MHSTFTTYLPFQHLPSACSVSTTKRTSQFECRVVAQLLQLCHRLFSRIKFTMNAFPKHDDMRLRRSRSMCSLSDDAVFHNIQSLHKERSLCGYSERRSRTASDSSEVFVVNDTDSETSGDGKVLISHLGFEGEVLTSLEQKIDRLSG